MLTERQLRLYSRQVILRELGQAGQAQLCATSVAAGSADAAATSIALDYLQRAGLQVLDDAHAQPAPVASTEEVLQTAGDPALRACAEWLHGAWAAVETIKQCAGVGTPAALATLPLALNAEVD